VKRLSARIGVVGCGNISGTYFEAGRKFEILEIVACADLDGNKAQARAREFGAPRVVTTEELLRDPEISIVLNLTTPPAHGTIAIEALEAGKSVYNEKPLALTREEARELLETAGRRNLRVGCAPDTFLGAGIQTCRKAIDEGLIGEPVAASAFMMSRGHESWHPDPAFYYKPGGGPMFDMGPYYLTALVSLMGPVASVAGATRITFPERTITSKPKFGERIKVEVPTHVAGLLNFGSGAIGTIVTSFDVWRADLPCIEVYGTEGSLSVPDPNSFGGPVRVFVSREKDWRELALSHRYAENARGLGVADMAHAIRSGRPHRANGELAYHVLDIMHAIHEASAGGQVVKLESSAARPAPMRPDLPEGILDD